MTPALKDHLVNIARETLGSDDPSHDIQHCLRVLRLAEQIAGIEGGDLEVIVPAALFHDVVNYRKDDDRAKSACSESAALASDILSSLLEYPRSKIPKVRAAILAHSFGIRPNPRTLEGKILRDADGLEATGAIAVMRTFASTGIMRRQFYDPADPFAATRRPDDHKFAIDLFYTRLLRVSDSMYTATARALAEPRTRFLRTFLQQLRDEIELPEPRSSGNVHQTGDRRG